MTEPIDLGGREIARLVQEASALLGNDWVGRRLKTDERQRSEASAANFRKRMIRHAATHTFIQWLLEYQRWDRRCIETNETVPNQSVILLATFASNLVKVQHLRGFPDLLSRLLKPTEFLSASFEVEVATGYVNRGWSVEFVQTGEDKSPDLKVTDSDAQEFWVECKRRDDITERDALVQRFFSDLKQSLYRRWGPAKSNLGLMLNSMSDPAQPELPGLTTRLLEAAEQLLAARPHGSQVEGTHEAGKYSFSLRYLADPDAEEGFRGFSAPDGYDFDFSGEVRQIGNGAALIRNPIWFAYRNDVPSDRFAGAINSFNAAVSQLPVAGPGVVWIRVPYPNGYPNAQSDLEALAKALGRELTGNQNTRVNAVVLSARVFSNEPNEGREALTYRHASVVIEHEAPRQPIRPRK